MESFFDKLKVELDNSSNYSSAEKLIMAVRNWITYYNIHRIQMKLGGTSPIKYRLRAA
ncbi:IS3 family transposase [Lentilactobacillus hilgardii]|nr:IS3 family transposase [Lentilactobacillus hilgardii]MCP9350586.1 IS3 family transposase [Lentilactobacillus hilgardii]MCP9353309.1 IS3 family transposase [Lentilactobacillus hilgardii]